MASSDLLKTPAATGPQAVAGFGGLLLDRVTGNYRYRVAATPVGYLVTARSRNAIGLLIMEQWLHREREAALACAAAVESFHVAWKAMGTAHAGGTMAAMQRASAAHEAVCARLGDQPAVGREVEALREAMLPDAP